MPTSPSTIPTSFRPEARSAGRNGIARSATQIGDEAVAIAATPESTWSVPSDERERQRRVDDAEEQAGCGDGTKIARGSTPALQGRTGMSVSAEIAIRPSMATVGAMSRTATSMNMKEAPQ